MTAVLKKDNFFFEQYLNILCGKWSRPQKVKQNEAIFGLFYNGDAA
jgi:hypothetical protein